MSSRILPSLCVLMAFSVTLSSTVGQTPSGQSLTEQLSKQQPSKLILEARERGNVVRGAILFHQGNIACAKCHRPVSEENRIGPDLSRLKSDVTNESLIESILNPSTVVAEDYKLSTVIRNDGLTTVGMIISDSDDVVVVRDSKDVTRSIKILRSNVEEIVPNRKSAMPDGLADELKDKQQFLDLLLYVIDVKERGPTTETAAEAAGAAGVAVRRKLSPEMQGLALIRKYNCVACHEASSQMVDDLKSSAPNLKWSGKHLNPAHLRQHILNPRAAKPGSTMPRMPLNASNTPNARQQIVSANKDQVAQRLVDFLTSLDGNTWHDARQAKGEQPNVKLGQQLFHSVGCVACHSPRLEGFPEASSENSIPLGSVSAKHTVPSLTEFLENPRVARPSGRMPDLQLTHHEAHDIAGYLAMHQTNAASELPSKNPDHIAEGRTLFQSLNCAKCHTGIIEESSSENAMPALFNLPANQGCLASEPPARVPNFEFSDEQRSHILAAINRPSSPLTNSQQIDLTLTHFNCTACHSRNNLGGVSPSRSVHFQTTNLNLGDQGRIPPSLTGVGVKLKPKWMRDVLVNGRSIRPYMKTRMPKFGENNVGHLTELFQQSDRLAETKFASFESQKETREFGHKLSGNQGLNCVACHTFQYKQSDTMPAVDLTEMSDRLHKDWFYQYMLSPQTFSPNTVMPSYWPDGNAIRKDLAGQPEDQVEALWQYLLDGRQARAPRGVIREPLEIVVTNEARMLRRSYPDIGKRGIGIGYPGGINVAFDAEQLRMALIWKGNFVDPSGVWYGQGHGRVRPMGKTIAFAKGPDIDDAKSPWIVDDERPPNHQFQGYSLDQKRRPTFRYSINSVNVEDYFFEVNDSKSQATNLRRRLQINRKPDSPTLNFRLASGSDIASVEPNEFAIGSRLRVRLLSNQRAVLSGEGDHQKLLIEIDSASMGPIEILVEYQWE